MGYSSPSALQAPNLEDGLPTGGLTSDHHGEPRSPIHPLGAHLLRVVGGRLPKGLGNLRDDISILTVRWVKKIDSGQICISPKPECFGHLGGRFPD